MIEMSDIYSGIARTGAALYSYDIGFSDAATIELNGRYAVMFDPSLFSSIRSLKWALAHENGHCATGCTHKTGSPWDLIERHEHKANRWAFETYLPPQEIQRAISAGYTEPWQLAEWFDIPQADLEAALRFYAQNRNIVFRVVG